MARELYYEKQQFSQLLFWLLITLAVIPMLGFLSYGMYQQLLLGEPWGNEPMSDLGIVLVWLLSLVVLIGVTLLFRFLNLEIQVDRNRVKYRFRPLINQWKEIAKTNIVDYKLIKYSFRGYGIRWGLDGIKTLNVKGDKGIEFQYAQTKKIILGTQQPELFLAAVNKMMKPELE